MGAVEQRRAGHASVHAKEPRCAATLCCRAALPTCQLAVHAKPSIRCDAAAGARVAVEQVVGAQQRRVQQRLHKLGRRGTEVAAQKGGAEKSGFCGAVGLFCASAAQSRHDDPSARPASPLPSTVDGNALPLRRAGQHQHSPSPSTHLQHGIHKAGVPQVVEAAQPSGETIGRQRRKCLGHHARRLRVAAIGSARAATARAAVPRRRVVVGTGDDAAAGAGDGTALDGCQRRLQRQVEGWFKDVVGAGGAEQLGKPQVQERRSACSKGAGGRGLQTGAWACRTAVKAAAAPLRQGRRFPQPARQATPVQGGCWRGPAAACSTAEAQTQPQARQSKPSPRGSAGWPAACGSQRVAAAAAAVGGGSGGIAACASWRGSYPPLIPQQPCKADRQRRDSPP